jgi:hypothetical protein
MVRVVRDWRVELVEAYSDLLHPVGDPPAVQGFPEVGDGWRDLLERACVRNRAAARANGGTFYATQVKEKYAALRFYWKGALSPAADAKVEEEAIDLAEARSDILERLCNRIEPGEVSLPRLRKDECVCDLTHHECPLCSSSDVVFAIATDDLPDEFAEALGLLDHGNEDETDED